MLVYLIIDAGGIVGIFSSEANARGAIQELKVVPGWGGVIFPWDADSIAAADTTAHFIFPMGTIAFPIMVGSKTKMAEHSAKLAKYNIVNEHDYEYYAATIDTIIPRAAARINPYAKNANALKVFTRMMEDTIDELSEENDAADEPQRVMIAELVACDDPIYP